MPDSPARQDRVHWIVRMNRRNRGGSFALLGLAMASHLHTIGAPAWAWAALAANYLLYPQLAYWRASRASNQRRAELQHMDMDFVLGGIWIAALGFPLWFTFIFLASGCVSLVVFHGARGGLRVLVDLALGIALGAAAARGLSWHPDTDLRTSLLCIVALEMYLFTFAHDGYQRAIGQYRANVQLHAQYEQIQSLQAQLREQALRDPLTGLFNRRHLDTVLGATLRRCGERAVPLAVVAIDIDHFKAVNDTQGHATGDAVLQALARLLAGDGPGDDPAFRLGGEEFLLMMPGASLAAAIGRAQGLRQAFETLQVPGANAGLSITLSCGVAGFPEHAREPQALLACADQALYAAKEQGRNRVVAYGPMSPPVADPQSDEQARVIQAA